ncbi:SnoaL-like domain-containing protein [Pseudomonas linyingensis]|jgi:hypothetical protein|uniref:SnoaL-like domain-containing protein n=1 Tax=Pseudomonas linyingensis TaxID=915471 RepID=A0A1H6ZKH6_9PSED|nr:nuclear transport factor 2 family protein [Pseudomonas linyingensis]SEJ54023.1 SnoaL-like domain-containing protein [Pseudomonas linyingensis]
MMSTGERAEMELHYILSRKLFQFGLAIDTLNLKELENVFDTHIVGEYNGVVGHTSRDQFISSVELNLGDGSNCGEKQHNIMNVQLLAYNEESATTRSNFYAIHQGKNDYTGKLWRTWGEYLDTWTLKDGEWRISFRKYTTYFNDGPDEINTPAA